MIEQDIIELFWNGSSAAVADALQADPAQAKAVQNPPGWSLLHIASFVDRDDIIQQVINLGADVDARNELSATPLHYAVNEGRLELAEILLRNGADPMAKSVDGATPLEWVSPGRHENAYDMIMPICKFGGRFEKLAVYALSETILHRAARVNRSDVVSLILHEGHPVDILMSTGRPPLFCAAEGDAIDTAALLLAHGADPDIKDAAGDSPITWVMKLHPYSDLLARLMTCRPPS